MAGAAASEAGQTSAGAAGWTEEEERREKVENLSGRPDFQPIYHF